MQEDWLVLLNLTHAEKVKKSLKRMLSISVSLFKSLVSTGVFNESSLPEASNIEGCQTSSKIKDRITF